MASNEHFLGETIPSIGDEFIVDVVQSPMRTTLFPDQIVALTTADHVELILLRQEVAIKSQQATVVDRRDDAVQVAFTPHLVRSDLTDIAHIRLPGAAALDLAFTILAQGVQSSGIDFEAIVQRLQTTIVQSK